MHGLRVLEGLVLDSAVDRRPGSIRPGSAVEDLHESATAEYSRGIYQAESA